jgi:hypothetical protein
MKNYEIVFCFLDENGYVESDKKGELFYIRNIKASNAAMAVDALMRQEKFAQLPEIVSIKSDMDKVFDLCKKIGIKTQGDLIAFRRENQDQQETLLEALERYNKELGEYFEIMEDFEK